VVETETHTIFYDPADEKR